jgi:hypothetical protein
MLEQKPSGQEVVSQGKRNCAKGSWETRENFHTTQTRPSALGSCV